MKVEGGKHCIQWRLELGVTFTITAQLRGGQQQGTAAPGTRGSGGKVVAVTRSPAAVWVSGDHGAIGWEHGAF